MVICRYFQQGGCRYGTACRNEHVYGNQYSYRSNNQANPPPAPNQNDSAYWIRAINADMTAAEQGKQWLLTSYTPFKAKPNFPSFEDHSFEEIRWLIYEAQKSGDVNNAIQIYSRMAQEAKQKFQSYKSPTRELLDIIKNVYLTTENSNTFSQNAFNQPPVQNSNPTSNIFGGAFAPQQPLQQSNSPVNIYNNATQVTTQSNSPLATNQSIFGAKPTSNTAIFNQQSIFSTNQQSQQPFTSTGSVFNTQPNAFGGSFSGNNDNRSILNTQQSQYGGTNVFNQAPQQTSTSPFNQSTMNSNSVFTQSQNIFSQNQNTISSPYGTTNTFNQPQIINTMETASPIFGCTQPPSTTTTVPANNIFNMQTSASNTFVQTNQNMFGQNTNIFDNSIQKSNSNKTSNIFGSKQVPQTTQVINQMRVDNDVYSKMDDLTEEDINAFNSDSFEFGYIPELPPPLSLCQ